MIRVKIRWGTEQTRAENPDAECEYEFATEAERDAFLQGVEEACGWQDYEITYGAP